VPLANHLFSRDRRAHTPGRQSNRLFLHRDHLPKSPLRAQADFDSVGLEVAFFGLAGIEIATKGPLLT